MQIAHGSVAEVMGAARYDWVAVDLEHGAIGVQQLPDLFRALESGGTLPLARLGQADARECKQVLDAGAGGVIAPMISSADQLTRIRDACRWPPAGRRGVGFSRANLFGKNFDRYVEEAQAPLLIAMIEDIRSVDDLDNILEVDGLDAVLIGPYDLSASMGRTAQFQAPEFVAAIKRVRSACSAHHVACGVHVVMPDPAVLRERIAEGFQFLAYGMDAVFLNVGAAAPQSDSP